MSSPIPPSTTALGLWQPYSEVHPIETRIFYCNVKLSCFDFHKLAVTNRPFTALISPGDAYSVLPPVRKPDPVKIYTEVVAGDPPSWFGVPCNFIRVRLGIPVIGSPSPRLFWLLALLPSREIEEMPPFLRLGAEFFTTNNATITLPWDTANGALVIP